MVGLWNVCNKWISKMGYVSSRLHTGWKGDSRITYINTACEYKVAERSREMEQIIKLQSTYIV
jgi:hypothetical protein